MTVRTTVTGAAYEGELLTAKQAKEWLRCTYKALIGYVNRYVLDAVVLDDDPNMYITLDSVLTFDQRREDDSDLVSEAIPRIREMEKAWREVLREATPKEALELLTSRYVNQSTDWDVWDRRDLDKAKDDLRRIVDKLDHDPSEARPRRVPTRAKRRTISTAIGKVPVWYWTSTKGYAARHGGPRPERTRTVYGPTLGGVIRAVGLGARTLYGKPVRTTSLRLRFGVLQRDGFACRYCGRKAPGVELRIDHVVPVAEGGSNDPDNLTAACVECNGGKADILLDTQVSPS